MALLDSAKAGRGLSEIAVYRDSTSFDEAQYSTPDSPVLSDTFDNEAVDVTNGHDDTEADAEVHIDENGFDAVELHEGHDLDEHTNTENDNEQSSIIAADATTVVPAEPIEPTEPTETSVDHFTEAGEDAAAEEQRPEGDLLDFSDDEIDLSPSKQGKHTSSLRPPFSIIICTGHDECQCEACFQVELERLDASWRRCSVTESVTTASPMQTKSSGWFQPPSCEGRKQNTVIGLDNQQNTNMYFHQDNIADEPLNGHETVTEEPLAVPDEVALEGTNGHMPPTTSNGLADTTSSQNSSATATLNGDDRDEIDYSDDEDGVGGGGDVTSVEDSHEPASLKVPDDEEITWESENEDAKNDSTASAPKGTVQVSSPHGKRTRAQSEEDEGEQNGRFHDPPPVSERALANSFKMPSVVDLDHPPTPSIFFDPQIPLARRTGCQSSRTPLLISSSAAPAAYPTHLTNIRDSRAAFDPTNRKQVWGAPRCA